MISLVMIGNFEKFNSPKQLVDLRVTFYLLLVHLSTFFNVNNFEHVDRLLLEALYYFTDSTLPKPKCIVV